MTEAIFIISPLICIACVVGCARLYRRTRDAIDEAPDTVRQRAADTTDAARRGGL